MKIPKATFWKKRQDQNCALTPSTGLQDTGPCKRREMRRKGLQWSRQEGRHLDLGAWEWGWGRNKACKAMSSQAPRMWTEMVWGREEPSTVEVLSPLLGTGWGRWAGLGGTLGCGLVKDFTVENAGVS